MGRGWRPLLEGPSAVRIEERVRADAARLALTPDAELVPVSVAEGTAGLALAFAYLHRAWPGDGYDEHAAHWLERAVAEVEAHPSTPSLHSGFTGVAWVITHLGADPDACVEVDEALLALTAALDPDGEYDLISGLVGIGVYALERGNRVLVDQVVERLRERAESPAPGTLAWRFDDRLDAGLAHGTPGVIGLAARAGARDLLDPAIAWLESLGPITPYWMNGIGELGDPARTAWCYGDPGVATALLAAGHREVALARAISAGERPVGVNDAGLCHGAAGIGHALNGMAQATGSDDLAVLARRWILETLDLPSPPTPGFLTGKAGVLLAQLAAIGPVPPDWDRLLLLDV